MVPKNFAAYIYFIRPHNHPRSSFFGIEQLPKTNNSLSYHDVAAASSKLLLIEELILFLLLKLCNIIITDV
jgi:hypothetical protein